MYELCCQKEKKEDVEAQASQDVEKNQMAKTPRIIGQDRIRI